MLQVKLLRIVSIQFCAFLPTTSRKPTRLQIRGQQYGFDPHKKVAVEVGSRRRRFLYYVGNRSVFSPLSWGPQTLFSNLLGTSSLGLSERGRVVVTCELALLQNNEIALKGSNSKTKSGTDILNKMPCPRKMLKPCSGV